MTIEDLKTQPAFVTLGPQQKEWVLAYCSNGADKIAATEAAYACNDTRSATATADRNLRHPAIKRLVNDFFGQVDETGSRDEFLAILWKKVQVGGEDQLDWCTLYAKVKGYEAPKAKAADVPRDSEAESVDDLVRMLEEQKK